MSLIHKVSDLFVDRNGPAPKNESWEEVQLRDACRIQNGFAFKSAEFNTIGSGMPLIRIRDIVRGETKTYFSGEFNIDYVVRKGDLLIGMDGDFNHALWMGRDALLNQRVCKLIPDESFILKKFLYYGLGDYLSVINENTSATTVKHLSSRSIGEIPFVLPPLPEQKRIVAKLDALFGHLNTLKTKFDLIPELLKNFRQQVLTLALTGRLTQEWRSNISGERKQLEEWNKVNIGSLGSWSGGGTPSKSKKEYWTGGTIPWITPKDMKSKFLNTSQDLITKESINKSSAKLIDKDSVLIVTRSGILRRILPVAINTAKCAINQDLKALSLNKDIYPKFILYAFIGLDQDIRSKCMKAGTTVESIEFSFLKDYELKLPNYDEQLEIVKRIESLFDLADRIESQHQSLKERIEYLPQAILNKAFKGELVPQDSNDEPAGELLKRIQKEKGGKKK